MFGKDERFPYSKSDHFLTVSEKRFFLQLIKWFNHEYYIFPQIHLSSLFKINEIERKHYSYLNKIDRKSVDFVLFDKESMMPVIALELDDYTHRFSRRMKRDLFVDKVFSAARLPIIHVSNFDNQESNLKEEIEILINKDKYNSQSLSKFKNI
ncbi:MAG TPA: DUF2726 domain-containing protein [Ignavibacteria bacterium]|nr:DUF2726 domain-containing protein [Ignavibacteria bacterium]